MKKASQKAPAVNLGSKRICPKCGTKFYDFGKAEELECPKCNAQIGAQGVAAFSPATEAPKKAPRVKEMPEDVLSEDEPMAAESESEFESLEELEESEEDIVDDLGVDEDENEY